MQQTLDFRHTIQKTVAAVHGVTPRTVNQWDKLGHEIARNPDGTYDLAKSFAWRLARETKGGNAALSAARARLAQLQGDRAEVELKVRRGDLLVKDVVVRDGSRLMHAMRSRLLALPKRAANTIGPPSKVLAVEEQLRVLVYEALEQISTAEFVAAVMREPRESAA